MVWPAIIAAGSSLIGGAIASKSQSKANASNERIAAQNNALSDAQFEKTFNQQQANYNRDVATNISQFTDLQRNSVYHRVKDAQQSGVHPLYALGASSSGASPAQVTAPLFGSPPNRDRHVAQANDGWAKGLAGAARAGAGYFARNSPEARIARRTSEANVELIEAKTLEAGAIADWYNRRPVDPATGRDNGKLNHGNGVTTTPLGDNFHGREVFKGKVKPQEMTSEKVKAYTKNERGGTSSYEYWKDDGPAGDINWILNGLHPWIKQIGNKVNKWDATAQKRYPDIKQKFDTAAQRVKARKKREWEEYKKRVMKRQKQAREMDNVGRY